MRAEDTGGRPTSWKQRGLALIPFAVGLPIANAIYAATGTRVRALPIKNTPLKKA